MITKFNKIMYAGLVCCGIAAALTACTDTWDDHYKSLGDSSGMHDGTIWEAIKADSKLSNFASVVEACDYARELNGSQVFTVFAPTNDVFTQAEAQQLIAEFKAEKAAGVLEEDNTVIKEFIQNHVALYNHSVSSESNDSIVLLNGKYATLTGNHIDGVNLVTRNQLYSNGVLYTLGGKVDYLSNVFEYVKKDPDLDSLYSFLYSSRYYRREFQPELSVAGSIVNGKTQYLDSVFQQQNDLFSFLGRLNSEDSTYIFVAPTNEVWRGLIDEYESYFNYPEELADRDSMVYTNSRLAIINGTTFSRTFNTDRTLQDSAMSVSSIRNYQSRISYWGAPFEYYEYRKPLAANGALNQSDIIRCSNGEVRKATKWNIDKQMGFFQYRIIEGEGRNAIKEVKKYQNSRGEMEDTWTHASSYVASDYGRFYNHVWSNAFVEFSPSVTTMNHYVDFYVRDVFSNIGYDIYLVTVPALANDSNATDQQRVPSKLSCTMKIPGYPDEAFVPTTGKFFVTKPDSVDYMLLAEDYKFPICTYDVEEEDLQILLRVETQVTAAEQRNNVYTRKLRVDCILLVPHGSLQLVESLPARLEALPEENYTPVSVYDQGQPGVIMYPHGQFTDKPFKGWYMLR